MHEVQTLRRLVVPPPAGVRTVWMFGFQRRLVRRCECDTLWPKPGFFLQISQTAATAISWVNSGLARLAGTHVRATVRGNRTRLPDVSPNLPTARRHRAADGTPLAFGPVN